MPSCAHRYNPPEAIADPTTAPGVEVGDIHLDDQGLAWVSPTTARTVTHTWLRTHCTYLPPTPQPPTDDDGRLEQLRRALDELAEAAGPGGATAAAAAHDALDDLADHHHPGSASCAALAARPTGRACNHTTS
ncbi:hypothetical protein ACFV1C_16100 [Streptomyces sp. NPDC059605]|uniref:hypothetical protein n=1 Tax=unclassified Streptomyces TaxID=2593676 RepID=UPI00368A02DF